MSKLDENLIDGPEATEEMPEEYKGLPIIEIETKELDIENSEAEGFTEYPIVGVVFVGDYDVARALTAYTLEQFCEDAEYIIERSKSDFCVDDDEEIPVEVMASTKITGYGAAHEVEEMIDVIGAALNVWYGYDSALGMYPWPDWYPYKTIFIVDGEQFTVDPNLCFESISLSDAQLDALKEYLSSLYKEV